jgi:hypothetical protein
MIKDIIMRENERLLTGVLTETDISVSVGA